MRRRVGGDTQQHLKPRPITSPDRPGLPDFSNVYVENMERPGYEAMTNAGKYLFIAGVQHKIRYYLKK